MSKHAKRNQPPPAAPPPTSGGKGRLVIAGAVVLGVAVVGFAFMRSDRTPAGVAEQAAVAPGASPASPSTPALDAQAPVLKPHPQTDFPPLRMPGYPLGRSPEVITAAYRFAAEHPEILTYVPCFCGCERSGHHGNEDCFVKSRGPNGDVQEWEDHGMECNVCLDVAQQAMQMYASGASVRDIRAGVESKWMPQAHTHTPTPAPPK